MVRVRRHLVIHSGVDHVVADTFLRFKGLERPAVIIVDAVAYCSDAGVGGMYGGGP